MASHQSGGFTEAELWLMEFLWQQGRATAHEALRYVPTRLSAAAKAIPESLKSLERRGLIRSDPTAVYSPVRP